MKKQYTVVLVLSNLLLLALVLSSTLSNDDGGTDNVVPKTENTIAQKVLAITIPADINFAGEQIPVEAFDVKERLDRELLVNTYWHSNSLQLFKLSRRAFPIIEPILEAEGVPNDFKYLALAESGLRNVVSPARAEGVWQFMKGTAKDYNLEVSSEVDERYHLEKATRAACQYLKKAKEELGSWSLAAASYNAGIPRIRGLLETQQTDNYFDLYLTTETARYVFRIVALKEVLQNPERYGFYLNDIDLYHPIEYKTVVIDTAIHDLPTFAIAQGTNYKTLKLLNPWLRQPYLNNVSKKTYEIKVPM
jgi:membrane-bound lytic murein transglycosylase D